MAPSPSVWTPAYDHDESNEYIQRYKDREERYPCSHTEV